jgi:CBS domain-containing protein
MVTQESLVRDAMVPDPLSLEAGLSAEDAGKALMRDEVRAVLVVEQGVLTGVITRKTLVREVVAAGLDPKAVELRSIVEPPNATIPSLMPLGDAYAFLEARDLERVPVVEADGRLVGVLSRGAVRRRIAEDDSPAEPDAPHS